MPGIITHMMVGAEVGGLQSSEFLLGNALPDFAVRIAGPNNPQITDANSYNPLESPEIEDGVALHHKTNRAYDGSALKAELEAAALSDLDLFASQLSAEDIKFCVEVGTISLLDGISLRRQTARSAYTRVRESIKQPGIADKLLSRLGQSIISYFEDDDLTSYADPIAVTYLLRNRLGLPRHQTPVSDEETFRAIEYTMVKQMERLEEVGSDIVTLLLDTAPQPAA